MIEAHDLSIGYNKKNVLFKGLRFQLPKGKLIGLISPNGGGKSTLIKTLGGLLPPLAGEISIQGRPLSSMHARERARYISIILTHHPSTPYLRVWELVSFGLYPHSSFMDMWQLSSHQRSQIERALAQCGALSLKDKYFEQLSDGQQQKVMLARTLVQATPFILLDEPTTYLDLPARHSLLKLLKELCRQQQKGILFSTHELSMAMQFCDVLWLLLPDGRLVSGIAEELGAHGYFDMLFAESGQQLDPIGMRYIPQAACGTYFLHGSEHPYKAWTRHLLERLGWQAATSPSGADIQIYCSTDSCWQIETREKRTQYYDWLSLHEALKNMGCSTH
ncbi:iron complex transport system ATP-binding protein [Thermonema lapsum]|uniref:Iron complex transport system ATP-binding protein n=1 Tax=Thermonema lapsum TaxID=28195 RepID=A0A846MMB2_9BACT|nr:ABC transporter ATP-binding protein [Thermonema lapsum]NIK72683.1 iron complex transport system ATP-binding protein [Thermonema lapsum]